MKNTMTKSVFREIKGSFGRWIAILAIVMLGVGFFSGLKICRESFITTADKFLHAHNMYDFKLVSTLGLEKKDVASIKSIDGIKSSEGSYSTDALMTVSNTQDGEKAASFHMLSDTFNTPRIDYGRMPSSANECIADGRYFSEEDIGKKIIISAGNSNDTLDMFKYKEYIISGLCESPLYLNFERGSTSLGDGSLACYFYIPEDGWKSDFYTEIYVDMVRDGTIYSKAYDDAVSELEKPLENALKSCANSRYDDILNKANRKLRDAQNTLSTHEKELKDGNEKIANAETEIANGEKKIAQAEKELEQNIIKLQASEKDLEKAKAEYAEGVRNLNEEKEAAYSKLYELEEAMEKSQGTPYYEEYKLKYDEAKANIDEQFQQPQSMLDAAALKIASGEKNISAGRKKIESAKAEIAKHKEQLKKSAKKVAEKKAEIKKGEKKIEDAKLKLRDARKKIRLIKNPKTYVLGRDTNIGYACFDNDSSIVNSIAKVFPIFFFLVASLVCMTTMTRMIDDQRTQIGVLKALGYSKSRIMNKYIFYSGSASLVGGLIGFFAGIYIFPTVIWTAYKMMYDFSDIILVFNWKLGILSILAALLCCVGATIYCCYSELSNVPAQLIRPKSPALGKRILLEKISFVWSKLKFLHKVCLRNIFRYKKRFFMMVMGICGCTALLIAGLGISDSIKNVVSSQYDEIFHTDFTVTFDTNMTPLLQEKFMEENKDVVTDALFLHMISVDARVNDEVKTISMIVADRSDPVDNFITLKNDEGNIPYPSYGKCVINSNLAQTLHVSVGDIIKVFDSDMREMDVEISALCDNYVNNYIYVNDQTYTNQWGKGDINSAFVIGARDNDGEISNPHEAGAYLMNAENVSTVSVIQDIRDRINNMMKSLDYVIALVVICAGALAFIVLYNLTNINITERIREIATIKVLGFYPSETNAYVFRENIVLTAISALIGIPVGKWFHSFVMEQIKIDLLSFDIKVDLSSYLLAVILTFVFAFIVNFFMYFKLDKISMTESLKSIE